MAMRALSIRGRIALLVVLAALPALGLVLYTALEVRARAEANAEAMLNGVSQHQAQVQENVLDGTRQTLVAMALPLRSFLRRGDVAGCTAYLKELLSQTRGLYHSMGLVRPDGRLFCNAVPFKGAVKIGERSYFKAARDAKAFAVGGYQVGQITKKPGINLAYPVLGEDGGLEAIAFLALDLLEIDRRVGTVLVPDGVTVTVEDHRGVVLASHAVGTREQEIGERHRESTVRVMQVRRDVGRNPDGIAALRITVGIPHATVVSSANQQLARNLLLVLLVTMVVGTGAWVGAMLTFVPRLRALLRAAHRVREGDLKARTGLPDDGEELARVGSVFDRMAETLEKRDAELQAAMQALQKQSITDALTGLYNRRYLEDQVARELQRAARGKQPLSVILFDIDHFKRVNDSFGHDVGDEVLRRVSALLKGAVRGSDIACRYGGEEFLLLLPGAPTDLARARAETIREQMPRMEITVAGRRIGPITASMGVATFPAHGGEAEALFKAADNALYRAKDGGRDRVELAGA